MKIDNLLGRLSVVLITPLLAYAIDINFIENYMNNYNKKSNFLMENQKKLYEKEIQNRKKRLVRLISNQWGKDVLLSSRYKSVSYSKDFSTRYIIDYKNEITYIESKITKNQKCKIKYLSNKLKNKSIQKLELSSTNNIIFQNKKYKENIPLKILKISSIIDEKSQNIELNKNTKNKLTISYKFSNKTKTKISDRYANIILKNAKRFNIKPSFIFSIIKTESAFYSRSYRKDTKATGLMQLVPKFGALDAYYKLNNKKIVLPKAYLLIPENNILLGTKYIEILKNDYLSEISNQLSKKYLVISAYNAGIGKILRIFNKNQKIAIKKINTLSANELFSYLQNSNKMPNETKKYLYDVLSGEKEFLHWNKYV